MEVKIKTNLTPNKEFMLQEGHIKNLTVPDTIVNSDSNYIKIMNWTNKFITLKKNLLFGLLTEIDTVLPSEIEQPEIRTTNPATIPIKKHLPTHLQKLFEKSKRKLTDEQVDCLRNLLIDYEDVFSRGYRFRVL
jgi:hypothetical protein